MLRKTRRIRGGSGKGKSGQSKKRLSNIASTKRNDLMTRLSKFIRFIKSSRNPLNIESSTSLTDDIAHIFPKEALKKLKELGINTAREIYELASPQQQCNNVIGKVIHQNDKCYLCGRAIYLNDPFLGLKPECEHVLPIAEAIFFLALYDHTKKGEIGGPSRHTRSAVSNVMSNEIKRILDIAPVLNNTDEEMNNAAAAPAAAAPAAAAPAPEAAANLMKNNINDLAKKVLKLEYRWAHRTCNQIKSDVSFIIENRDGIFIPNDRKIREVLHNIGANKRPDGELLRYLLYKKFRLRGRENTIDVQAFVESRVDKVKAIVQKICDHINEKRVSLGGIFEIVGLLNIELIPENNKKLKEIYRRNPELAHKVFDYTDTTSKEGINKQFEKDYNQIKIDIKDRINTFLQAQKRYDIILDDIINRYKNIAISVYNKADDELKKYIFSYIQYRIYTEFKTRIDEADNKRNKTKAIADAIAYISSRSGLNEEILNRLFELERA